MHAEASRGVCVRCARAAKCAAAEIILAITILEQVHFEMQVKYNFPLKLLILDREYKHVLTWQKTGDETFDIEKPEPPTDVPDPTLLSRSGASALAQGPDKSPDQSPEGTYGWPRRWRAAFKKWLSL